MEQQVWDAQGRLRARSVAEGYRRDPRTGLYVPTAVRVECPQSQFSMRVDLARGSQPVAGQSGRVVDPASYPGYALFDLGSYNFRPR